MTNFEILPDKVELKNLRPDDHVYIKDQFWRVIENLPVLGGSRMLKLAYHEHVEPLRFNFHPVEIYASRVNVFRKID